MTSFIVRAKLRLWRHLQNMYCVGAATPTPLQWLLIKEKNRNKFFVNWIFFFNSLPLWSPLDKSTRHYSICSNDGFIQRLHDIIALCLVLWHHRFHCLLGTAIPKPLLGCCLWKRTKHSLREDCQDDTSSVATPMWLLTWVNGHIHVTIVKIHLSSNNADDVMWNFVL